MTNARFCTPNGKRVTVVNLPQPDFEIPPVTADETAPTGRTIRNHVPRVVSQAEIAIAVIRQMAEEARA